MSDPIIDAVLTRLDAVEKTTQTATQTLETRFFEMEQKFAETAQPLLQSLVQNFLQSMEGRVTAVEQKLVAPEATETRVQKLEDAFKSLFGTHRV